MSTGTATATYAGDLKRPAMTHALKTWPQYFGDIVAGVKTFEVRRADRDFRVGDLLELREYEPNLGETDGGHFTGRSCTVEVSYLLEGDSLSLPSGYVYMGIKKPDTAVRPLGWEENADLRTQVADLKEKLKREQSFIAYKQREIDTDDWKAGYARGLEEQRDMREHAEDARTKAVARAVDAEARVEPYARELQAVGKALGLVGSFNMIGLSMLVERMMVERDSHRSRAADANKRWKSAEARADEFRKERDEAWRERDAAKQAVTAKPDLFATQQEMDAVSAYDRARCAAETQLRIDGLDVALSRAIGRAIEAAR